MRALRRIRRLGSAGAASVGLALLVLAPAETRCAELVPERTAAAAEAVGTQILPPARIVTLLDYFESGRSSVRAFVESAPRRSGGRPELAEVIERAKRRCVRIEARFDENDAGSQSVGASGVLVDGGRRVLTAGHSLARGDFSSLTVTLSSGEVRRARIERERYRTYGDGSEDWAVLELLDPAGAIVPPLGYGEFREGELVIALGYPEQIGINADGALAYASTAEGEYLEALTTLAVVERTQPVTLAPRSGSLPTGGMSGGPVFDSRGRLLGLFASIVRSTRAQRVTYHYRATPVSAIPARPSRSRDAASQRGR